MQWCIRRAPPSSPLHVLLPPRVRPAYLAANAAGPAKYAGKNNSHFSPSSALFRDAKDESTTSARRWEIIVSDCGFFGALGLLAAASYVFSPLTVAAFYGVPYLVTNLNLVLITYLQHTDAYVPHYRDGEFDWLRGAIATVDRSYGWVLDTVFHHIADTHVVHHLFFDMPFYHAQEATMYVREILGDYYLRDNTPIPLALWRAFTSCRYVDNDGGIVFFKGAQEFNKELAKKTK